jgi:hypothetical protein
VRSKAIAAFLAAITSAALLLPAGSGAKPRAARERVVPARTTETMRLHGTHGYVLDVTALGGRWVTVTAIRDVGQTASLFVSYSRKTGNGAGGGFHFRLGQRGKFDLRFVPGHVKVRPVRKGCEGEPSRVEHGTFVGSVDFEGEGGFTTVVAHRVRGIVTRSGRRRCPAHARRRPVGARDGNEAQTLRMISGDPSGTRRFEAGSYEGPGGFGSPIRTFLAFITTKEEELSIARAAFVFEGSPTSFVTPDADRPMSAATVEPPAPFSGSASFRLTSPTTGTYSGDLAVELPGVARMPLTGPGIDAGICKGFHCTKTLPRALRPRRTDAFDGSYFVGGAS